MSGERDLAELLRGAMPELHPGEYVFCTVDEQQYSRLTNILPLMVFHEKEGITLIVKREVADQHQLQYPFIARWITMNIHSSLDAVGFTAAFATQLTKVGISCNVVAAFYHDHLFVGADDAERAVQVLSALGDR